MVSRGRKVFSGAVFLSFLIHFLCLSLLFYFHEADPEISKSNDELPLRARILNPLEYRKLYTRNQVVETALAAEEKLDESKKYYLGEQDQSVDRETKSKSFGSVSGRDILRSPISTHLGSKNSPFEKKEGAFLSGTTGQLRKGSFDLLKEEIAFGPVNLLNTRKFKFASFFNRLNREIAPRWNEKIRRSLRENGRILEGVYVSHLKFYLGGKGQIFSPRIEKKSGFGAFDSAAFYALLETPPMQNIPEGLLAWNEGNELDLKFVVTVEKGAIGFRTLPGENFRRRNYRDFSSAR